MISILKPIYFNLKHRWQLSLLFLIDRKFFVTTVNNESIESFDSEVYIDNVH